MNDAPSPRAAATESGGFTIIEILLVVAILGTLMALAFPMYAATLDAARIGRAISDMRAISRELEMFRLRTGMLPETLEEAEIRRVLDPYGRPYEYLRIEGLKGKGDVRKDHKLNPINSDFDLYSLGRDGVSKTQVSNKDSLDDIIRANDGGYFGLGRDY